MTRRHTLSQARTLEAPHMHGSRVASRSPPHELLHAHHFQRTVEQRALTIGKSIEDREVIIVRAGEVVLDDGFPLRTDQPVLLVKAVLLLASDCGVERRI